MTTRIDTVANADMREVLFVLQLVSVELSAIADYVLPLVGAPARVETAPREPQGPSFMPTAADWATISRELQSGKLVDHCPARMNAARPLQGGDRL